MIRILKLADGTLAAVNSIHIVSIAEAEKRNQSEVSMVGGKKLIVNEVMMDLVHKLNH